MSRPTVYTIGHSTHSEAEFLRLLRGAGITAVGDVRSAPYSRWNPQFDREVLQKTLRGAGIEYVYLGDALGARTSDASCYDKGVVNYTRLAQTTPFRDGLRRVMEGAEKFRIALMCAEKEPLECHRTILVARQLVDARCEVVHIHADGRLEPHEAAMLRLAALLRVETQTQHMFRSADDLQSDLYELQERRIAYTQEQTEQTETAHAG